MSERVDVEVLYGWKCIYPQAYAEIATAIGMYETRLGSRRVPTCDYCGRQGRAGHNCDGCGAQVRQ